MSQLYTTLYELIIRPPRYEYDEEDLGPSDFFYKGQKMHREDFQLVNPRKLKIEVSHYHGLGWDLAKTPCVIYCHGNAGSRLDGGEAVRRLLPLGVSVVCFDAAGSGKSEGEYVSLGWFEKDDVATIVNHLRDTHMAERIGIWGRSMGAVTALFYASTDPTIVGLVLDSPFSSLVTLADELSGNFLPPKVPKMFVSLGMKMVRNSIRKKAGFDIKDLDTLKIVDRCFSPALFAHGSDDNFIKPHHSQLLHDKYAGDKNIVFVDGDHNDPRPGYFFDSVSIFFANCFSLPIPDISSAPEDFELPPVPMGAALLAQEIGEENLQAFLNDTEDEQMRQAIYLSLQDVAIPQDCLREDLSDAQSQAELRAQLEAIAAAQSFSDSDDDGSRT